MNKRDGKRWVVGGRHRNGGEKRRDEGRVGAALSSCSGVGDKGENWSQEEERRRRRSGVRGKKEEVSRKEQSD